MGPLNSGTRGTVCQITPGAHPENVKEIKFKAWDSGGMYTVKPEMFSILNRDTNVLAARVQFAFNPGYAITFHRCQGLTLGKVAVRFSSGRKEKWTPSGMVYVALSRCRRFEDLWIEGLTADHIKVSTDAVEYICRWCGTYRYTLCPLYIS